MTLTVVSDPAASSSDLSITPKDPSIALNDPAASSNDPSIALNDPPNPRNAAYVELLGSGMNLLSLNYERRLRNNLYARFGASWLGYSRELRYEDRGNDLFIDLFTIPASVSYTFFEGIRQLEVGGGLTYLSFTFDGGPFDIGYQEVELGNRYRGLAITSTIAYRVTTENYIFRIGLSPHYMLTLDAEITGFLYELHDRDLANLKDVFDWRGFRIMPGLSFGRMF